MCDDPHKRRLLRHAGCLLIVTAISSIVFMAMHPTSGAQDIEEFADLAVKGFPGNAMVHGILLALAVLMSTALLTLADLLGSDRLIVRLASGSFMLGTFAAIIAGLINGFILPGTAAYLADGAEQGLTAIFRLCQVSNGTCARVCVIGWSTAAVLWGIAMLGRGGVLRVVGPIGVLFGLTPVLMLSHGHLPMNVMGFGMFVGLHSVWGIAAGIAMVRARGCTRV